MPLDFHHEIPAGVCSAIDWAHTSIAAQATERSEVRRRVAAGERPERLVPLACVRGKFRVGRFVDEQGAVYRLDDVVLLLNEVPDTRADLRVYRRQRAVEIASTTVAVAVVPVAVAVPLMFPFNVSLLAAGLPAANASGSARAALARAVSTYNSASFWQASEKAYAGLDATIPTKIPTSVLRTTELLTAARGCATTHDDPRFAADAQVVWDYARAGYDASALVVAAEAAPASATCDLHAALADGLALTIRPAAAWVDERDAAQPAAEPGTIEDAMESDR
jgi:hypothetical protein